MAVVGGDPVNPQNKLVWTQEFRQMLGFNNEREFPNVLGSWSDRLHPDDKKRTVAAFTAHLNDNTGKTPFNVEYRLMVKSGEYRYFHAFGTTLRDGAGTPLRVAGALMDIDTRKQTQNQLMVMLNIIQNSPNFIAYKKLDGECLYINPAASVITGYSQDELIKDYIAALCDEETAKNISGKIDKELREIGITQYEITGKVKDGSERTFAGTSFLIENDAYATMVSDVTESKELEIEKQKALEQAELASKAKSDFLSNMSHEIRTPLNAVIGMTALGKSSESIEYIKTCLSKIEDASQHLLGVINDILDMSKIEANKFELSSAEFYFEKMLQSVENVVNFRVEEKRQKFTVHIDNTIPKVLIGDNQRLAQVITNLLGNAVKFTPEEGEIHLDTQFMGRENDVCTIKISLTDSGIGITPEQQAKLFQSFQQAESATARKYGGTGLGLSISKSIVEMMGGKLWVESEPDKGSTFSFTFQMKQGAGADGGSPGAGQTRPDDGPVDIIGLFADKCILLAEDVEINREIVLALLEPTGLKIDCAENGKEALDKFSQSPGRYDMIFMDVQMPEMDGYEATRAIRAHDAQNAGHIPIIAMTANVFKEDVEKCIACGMNGHVGKPLDFNVVIGQLRQHLQR
jgi:PAS domain S-box-containing protein